MVTDYIILGAGISGSLIAKILAAKGHSVLILDKGRSVGGRLSCKRMEDVYFNHGLSNFDCEIAIRPWAQLMLEKSSFDWADNHSILIPANQIIKEIIGPIATVTNEEITEVISENSYFLIKSKTSKTWIAKNVICTFPAPQALKILSQKLTENQNEKLKAVLYSKKIILFLSSAYKFEDCESYTVQRKNTFFMVSFSDFISNELFDFDDETIASVLLKKFELLGQHSSDVSVKKWRYARCILPTAEKFISNAEKNLFLIGDYFGEQNVSSLERTLQSAEALEAKL